jgi:uncharacterized protein
MAVTFSGGAKFIMPEFKIEGNAVGFWLRVKPRSTHERLTHGGEGELKLELHAPATGGQANDACIRFFASALRLPHSSVEIVSGQRSRKKLIRIVGRTAEEVVAQLYNLMGGRQGGGSALVR